MDEIFGSDEILDCYLLFRELELKQRVVGQDIMEYLTEWETMYHRAKDRGVVLDEKVKAFKLLMTCNLDELDLKLVLSEVDMKTTTARTATEGAAATETTSKIPLFDQVKIAIRKYHYPIF